MKKCVWCNYSFENSTFKRDGKYYHEKFCCNKCRSEYSNEYGSPKYDEATNPYHIYICVVLFLIYCLIELKR